jgi:hypothetical protein
MQSLQTVRILEESIKDFTDVTPVLDKDEGSISIELRGSRL